MDKETIAYKCIHGFRVIEEVSATQDHFDRLLLKCFLDFDEFNTFDSLSDFVGKCCKTFDQYKTSGHFDENMDTVLTALRLAIFLSGHPDLDKVTLMASMSFESEREFEEYTEGLRLGLIVGCLQVQHEDC